MKQTTAGTPTIKRVSFIVDAYKSALPIEPGETYHTPAQRAEMARSAADQLAGGNDWAWADIRVSIVIKEGTDQEGRDLFGMQRTAAANGFSFLNEDDFKESALYAEMKNEAFNELLYALI